MRNSMLGVLVALSVFQIQPNAPARAQTALSGQITSAEEGAMEGVLVSAKRAGSTITVTVASDTQGRYSFPAAKLEPGQYALRIRAAGYDLEGSALIDRKSTRLNSSHLVISYAVFCLKKKKPHTISILS